MSDPALSPAQLDLLEDALEDLEHGGLPSALLDPQDDEARGVVDTLEVYRSILAMSRQALPSEDVPAGLLDDVLAEARRAAAVPAKVERAVPWYRRLGGWGPALAFAGSAALLVVLVRPMNRESGESEAPAIARQESEERKAERAPASAADETPAEAPAAVPAADADADAEPSDEAELDGLKLADAQGKAEAHDAWDDLGGEAGEGRGAGADTARRENAVTKLPAAEAPGRGVVGGTSKSSSSTAPADKKAKGDAYDPKPAAKSAPKSPPPQTSGPMPSAGGAPAEPAKPVTKPGDAEEKKEAPDGWADIATGDAKRRAGACSSAKTAYQRAVEDDSAEVRARALAGLGLCELDAGNTSAAESLFAKARKTDPEVDKLIAAERARHESKDEAQVDQAAPP